ncbi:DUF1302 family protein [uncultured Nevskia sp.]|uniref:DUF1302 family protein n=1 Tax=uncultured Nevskia sp. TaxID=228950 RepID=UPI0025E4E7E9|nr:DUF1302 family protein [uncultured Nevskia sp.]
MKVCNTKYCALIAAGIAAFASGGVQAAGGAGSKFLGADFSYNGFIRFDVAFSTDDRVQQVNQFGDLANGVPIRREPGNPALNYAVPLQPTDALIGPAGIIPLSGIGVLPPTRGVSNQVGVNDTVTRYVPLKNQLLNYHLLRFELTPTLAWGDWSLITRLRATYDPDNLGYLEWDASGFDDLNGGFDGGSTPDRQFQGKSDKLGYAVDGKKNPLFFERSGRNYMVDLPAFFLQWNSGNTTVRVGNQTVAWGQLLFFRIMDTANGLDLRRHLILNRALEEYADARASAPGIRITSQITDTVSADFFAQQFIPTVLNSVNTSYNVVPSQFYLHDRYWQDEGYKHVNYGIRFKGEFGNYNLQAMATRRYNPLGAIRWTQSGVNKALPNSNILGAVFNQYCNVVLGTGGQGCGPILAQTPFEASPAGVFSAEEWFNYAGYIKLDAMEGLDRAIDEFDASQMLLAAPANGNHEAAANELSAFFQAGEGLHGHIERKYFLENVFGLGGGYVTEAEPGSIFDQVIMNLETTFTPKRVFTSPDLRQGFDKRSEIQVGFVAEKYQRFSTEIPATYMVFQYLWQKESDLVGLLLDGYGGENYSRQGIKLDPHVPTSTTPKTAPGIKGGANYVVLAALQPFPNYIWELSAATLIDVQGGVLFQPGLQWKPRGNITVNMFYNLVLDNAWGNNPNKNLVHLISQTNELALRLGYQF